MFYFWVVVGVYAFLCLAIAISDYFESHKMPKKADQKPPAKKEISSAAEFLQQYYTLDKYKGKDVHKVIVASFGAVLKELEIGGNRDTRCLYEFKDHSMLEHTSRETETAGCFSISLRVIEDL